MGVSALVKYKDQFGAQTYETKTTGVYPVGRGTKSKVQGTLVSPGFQNRLCDCSVGG